MTIFLIYYTIINIAGFSFMGIDKKRAIRGAWRISEDSLFPLSRHGPDGTHVKKRINLFRSTRFFMSVRCPMDCPSL